ncbi:hypothetical protein [Pseudosulfitobacter pseudonitzschiae]|uniref:hypothetical protein n=1 Tax=Pseudosulfitobacter pseudonitzschiae TaxID=1402135 RepID=UPI00296605E0|nr:hypothetical protein [Pseudosulfitobacter pseudonitzschiae]
MGDVDVTGVCHATQGQTNAKLAFIQAERIRPDDGPTQPKCPGRRHGGQDRPRRTVGRCQPFCTQQPDQPRPHGLPLFGRGAQVLDTFDTRAHLVGVFANIDETHICSDTARHIPIRFVTAVFQRRLARDVGQRIIFQKPYQIGICAHCDAAE